jgi:hypothetical protein
MNKCHKTNKLYFQNALHVRSLREAGYETEAILNFVSLIGGGFDKEYSLKKMYSIEELIQRYLFL